MYPRVFSSDVGRNPMGPIFHVWRGSYGEHEEHAEEHEGNYEGKTRETLN